MDFNLFVDSIQTIQKASLPGIESHLKMTPLDRDQMIKLWDYSNAKPRKAGVLTLFYPKGSETHLVLIVRSSKGVHFSQVALPGGSYDPEDQNLAETATRETYEEIGVPKENISVIKELTEIYVQPSDFLVYPFLGYIDYEPHFIPQVDEVSKIIEISLTDFLKMNVVHQAIKTSYRSFPNVPTFKVDGHLVWGATAMILSEVKDILTKK